jgi:ABC-type molybdate transport system ATPase subunit
MHDRRLSLLFQDATLAPKMHKRKKLHLRGKKVRDRAVLGRIFTRAMDHS